MKTIIRQPLGGSNHKVLVKVFNRIGDSIGDLEHIQSDGGAIDHAILCLQRAEGWIKKRITYEQECDAIARLEKKIKPED